MDETELLRRAGGAAQDVAQRAGGGIFSFFGNMIMSPVRMLGNIARGAWNMVVSPIGIGAAALGAAVVGFAPDVIRPAMRLIGREDLADGLVQRSREGGMPAVLLTGAAAGLAVAGAGGALFGVKDSLLGAGDSENGGGFSLGSFIGTGLTLAAVTAVTIGAIHRNSNIRHDATASAEVTVPPAPRPSSGAAARADA